MLTTRELIQHFRDRERDVREGSNAVLKTSQGRKVVVGKHEAQNYAHLERVLSEADEACPRAADTIRWLLWHKVLDAQWYMYMAEMLDEREPI